MTEDLIRDILNASDAIDDALSIMTKENRGKTSRAILKNIRDLTARKYYFDHKHEIESNDIFIMDLIRGINYEI